MGKPQTLWLHDVGACTPLGFCAASSAAAAWAGISRIAAPEVPVAGTQAPVYQAICPILDADAALVQRLATLASVALIPMLNRLEDWPGCLTVFVALPLVPGAPMLAAHVTQAVQRSLSGHRRGPQQSLSLKPITAHPGEFGQILQAAARYLAAPTSAGLCILGGVDSHVSACRLRTLEAEAALYDPQTGEGVMPGEAAAFLTVSLPHEAAGRPVLAQIDAWHQSPAVSATQAEQTPSALALQRSVEHVLPQGAPPHLWVSDATGEAWRAKGEACLATAASLGAWRDTQMLEPARLMGETGLAYAPLACGLALHGINHGLVCTTQALMTAQDREHATAWLLTARAVHTTPLACDAPWHNPPKRAL